MQNSQTTLHFPLPEYPTTADPLTNLAAIQTRLNSLSQTLSDSVNSKTPLSTHQSSLISSELSTAILHVIINGASLITKSDGAESSVNGDDDLEIIEPDVDTLTADHSHVCEFCGKCFKRDANLRMHMRAHGDRFKTLESLARPAAGNGEDSVDNRRRRRRFSCPYVGCDRNKNHSRFRPLKSAVCVKNHFKRFHCAKMFFCSKCKCKSFSVLGDLKRHMKVCGAAVAAETVEVCSCGVKFATKEELFRHVSVSEGHMPATHDDDVSKGGNDGFGLINDDDDQEMRLWSSIEEIFNL